jgi:hypothetical protein
MNPKSLQSNGDVVGYLLQLAEMLDDQGQSSLSNEAILASRFSSGSPSEFLHEAQSVLEKVLELPPEILSAGEQENVRAVVAQIKEAFAKIGGA